MFWFKKFVWAAGVFVISFLAMNFFWTAGNNLYQNLVSQTKKLCPESSCLGAADFRPLLPESRPENSYSLKNKNKILTLGAEAYYVADVLSGEIILSQNEKSRQPIASVTKLITALVAIEMIKDEQVLENAAQKIQETYGLKNNSNGNLQNIDFLYPLLLQSSNQTAEILANEVGWPNFIRQMNEKASALGMSDTLLTDPSGLTKENISTAKDLFKLAQYLKKNRPNILELTKTEKEETLGQVWFNHSRFLSQKGYLGGKTGFTNDAGQTLLAIFSVPIQNFERKNIAVIILQSPNRAQDVQSILDYLRQNVLYQKKALLIPEIEKKSETKTDQELEKNNHLKIIDRGEEHFEIKNNFPGPDWFPPNISLTINGGPKINGPSEKILEVLNQYAVPATFFLVGQSIEKSYQKDPFKTKNYLEKLIGSGHALGYYSYKKRPLIFLGLGRLDRQTESEIIEDIEKFKKILNKALGQNYSLKLGRAKGGYGTFNPKVISAFEKSGLEKPKYWHSKIIPTNKTEIAKILMKKDPYVILINDTMANALKLEKFLTLIYNQRASPTPK